MWIGLCGLVAGTGCRLEPVSQLILLPVENQVIFIETVMGIGIQPGIDSAFKNINIRQAFSLEDFPGLGGRSLVITHGNEDGIGEFELKFPGFCLNTVQRQMHSIAQVELVVVALIADIQRYDLDL